MFPRKSDLRADDDTLFVTSSTHFLVLIRSLENGLNKSGSAYLRLWSRTISRFFRSLCVSAKSLTLVWYFLVVLFENGLLIATHIHIAFLLRRP